MKLVSLFSLPSAALTRPNSFAVPLSTCLSLAVVPFFFPVQPEPTSLLISLLFPSFLLSLSLSSPCRCIRINPLAIPCRSQCCQGYEENTACRGLCSLAFEALKWIIADYQLILIIYILNVCTEHVCFLLR